MPTQKTSSDSFQYSANLVLLLVALVLVLMIAPLFEKWAYGKLLLYGVITLMLLAGGSISSARRGLFPAILVLLVVALPIQWTSALTDWPLVFVASCLIDSVVCGLLAGMLLLRVVRREPASWQSIAGVIAAYLLLGLTWAMLYWATERIESESLTFAHTERVTDPLTGRQVASFSQMVYFSFVTMSTLGYGDVTPLTPVVRTLAWMQAVTGQFYIAVLVARLVADLRPGRVESDS